MMYRILWEYGERFVNSINRQNFWPIINFVVVSWQNLWNVLLQYWVFESESRACRIILIFNDINGKFCGIFRSLKIIYLLLFLSPDISCILCTDKWLLEIFSCRLKLSIMKWICLYTGVFWHENFAFHSLGFTKIFKIFYVYRKLSTMNGLFLLISYADEKFSFLFFCICRRIINFALLFHSQRFPKYSLTYR